MTFLKEISYNTISLEDAMKLEIDFFEEEVWKAMKDLEKQKAPARCFQYCFFPIMLECF